MKKLLLLFCIVLVFSSCGTENVVTNDTEYEFSSETATETIKEYIINKDTKKYHIPSCSYALDIKEENKEYANMDFIISREYTPCSRCIK